jgi:hypothetical protein
LRSSSSSNPESHDVECEEAILDFGTNIENIEEVMTM